MRHAKPQFENTLGIMLGVVFVAPFAGLVVYALIHYPEARLFFGALVAFFGLVALVHAARVGAWKLRRIQEQRHADARPKHRTSDTARMSRPRKPDIGDTIIVCILAPCLALTVVAVAYALIEYPELRWTFGIIVAAAALISIVHQIRLAVWRRALRRPEYEIACRRKDIIG